MKQIILSLTALLLTTVAPAENRTYRPEVKSLQAVVNQDWLSPAVMQLKGDDVLYIGFDELSHDYHRYVYRLERCEADWTTSEELFESDWLQGFNHHRSLYPLRSADPQRQMSADHERQLPTAHHGGRRG